MDPLALLIDALHGEGRLRVWSLVITVFGDLVQHRGGRISTARLGRLLGRVGVEQGALRTALSRLGRDGWVESARNGRISHYRLSPQGKSRFVPATGRIYAAPRMAPVARWALALSLGENGSPRVVLGPAQDAPKTADCLVEGDLTRLSAAYRETLLSPEQRAALAALAADLAALDTEIADPLDAAAARMLLIHRWRRIVLRFDEVPAELMPDTAPLIDPRKTVARAYARLSPAAERWLDGDFAGLGPMPPADSGFALRFGGARQA